MTDSTDIEHLNADCTCITLDLAELCRAAEEIVGDPAFCRELSETHPHLLSAQPLFLSSRHATEMQAAIRAIEAVARLPLYRDEVLAQAPELARADTGPIGVFMGYDFHIGEEGPRLIEVNTNAGGALINTYLLMAQRSCCEEMAKSSLLLSSLPELERSFVDTFREEWKRLGRTTELKSVAIVDETPRQQYLYPEFVLFERLLRKHGIVAVIAAPEDLELREGKLWVRDEAIDLVYNRLTDFSLSRPASAVLRDAYTGRVAAVTPHPRAHALLADKRNLIILSNPEHLRQLGADDASIATLARVVPRTELVTPDNAADLWTRRSNLFFKPASGFGSKAAYRGDKLTRKTWESIVSGDYVAQAVVPPSARAIAVNGEIHRMKVDLRCYTYDGRVQLFAARVYEGQTTNFRTLGGGFAPVFIGDSGSCTSCG